MSLCVEQALLAIAYAEDVQEIIHTPHGVKYIIEGKIATPQEVNRPLAYRLDYR
ncbi:hypothetical protein [Thermocoleostomius sinensis]|uniref:Uncharacterized protein n=1 Tax=Thermocoleostomius sinensis A174 TaxID=2016057 RepID=A0A9E8ZBC3_9CYAN|nr:hypothetical protein [Thermocoleostomius sinensis]WAL58722.1 hypothetical protein OXH18_16260 [Thermocoleostomius sinensis A174]